MQSSSGPAFRGLAHPRLRYRPATYAQAAGRFANLRRHHPLVTDFREFEHPERGAYGERLRTQVLRLGPKRARRAAVVSTGFHGSEYLPGAALVFLLAWLLQRRGLPRDTAFVLIDGVNPWGASWGVREDENGCDPNRIFATSSARTDYGYSRVHDLVCAQDFEGDHWNEVEAKRSTFTDEHGEAALFAPLGPGQVTHVDGLYFAGDGRPSFVRDTFMRVLERETQDAEVVIHVDAHTSLGEFGAATVITTHEPDSEAFAFARNLFGPVVQVQSLSGPSIAYPVSGTSMQAASEFSNAGLTCSVTLELGTFSRAAGLSANIASNLLARKRWAPTTPLGRRVRQHIAAHFAPADDRWWSLVFGQGERVFSRLLDALKFPATLSA